MLKVSVSNLELFRIWQADEDLDTGWLMERLLGQLEQTPQMQAGEALHKGLELARVGETEVLEANGYRFLLDADCQIVYSPFRELDVCKQYGDLLVTGRVDSLIGNTIVDYKSGTQFDPDRLLASYQWRYYLDMTLAVKFEWQWFGLADTDDPHVFHVLHFHRLNEHWYPELHSDCRKLAREYYEFAHDIPALNRMAAQAVP